MSRGIRAEVRVDPAGACPVTRVARQAGTSTVSITKGADPTGDGRVTEEFMLDIEDGSRPEATEEMTEVFAYGSNRVYQFEREVGSDCPCEVVEAVCCPIVDAHTNDGGLHLVFHAEDIEELRAAIGALQEQYESVDVRRLLRSSSDGEDPSMTFVDRERLTDRQREVLETAYEMGYFDHPKGANAGEVAEALGIDPSTFAEHIAAAQSKLLECVVE